MRPTSILLHGKPGSLKSPSCLLYFIGHRLLTNIPKTFLQLFIGLLVCILTSPLLLAWRLSLSLLLSFAAYKPTLAHYQKRRTSFHTHPMVKPIATRWVSVICTILLLIQIFLALALLNKSLTYFVPWLAAHFQRTQYKREHEEVWRSELVLHLSGFVLTCVPFFGALGVAAGMLYYTRKARIHERFGNNMMVTRQPGASESAVADVESEEAERFAVVEDEVIENCLVQKPCNVRCKTPPHGVSQCGELGLTQQWGNVREAGESSISAPPPVTIPTRQATVVGFQRNRHTPAGVMSIWSSRNSWSGSEYGG